VRTLGAPRDAATALRAIAAAGLSFLGHDDGSGTHLAEQALWRAAAVAPAAPWFRPPAAGIPLLRQAREAQACCLVERPRWAADAGRGLVALVEGDPALAVELRVQRGLRAPHHAAQLFVGWLTGRGGRALLARGLRAPA
jgi:tungstate transport system substrate-binding protein